MKEALNGFSAVFDSLSASGNDQEELDILDVVDDGHRDGVITPDDEDEEDEVEIDEKEKDVEEEKEEKNTEDENPESDVVETLFTSIFEGIDINEMPDDEKPKSVEDVISLVKEAISKDNEIEYASEEVKEINEFVKNGGRIEDYMSISLPGDYEGVDMSSTYMQKEILKEYMIKKGVSESQIQRKIEKYEDADILEDEANDALESLKEIAKEEKKALLEGQENMRKQREEEQQRFYNSVKSEIESLVDVRGIQVPKADKNELIKYIFEVESDGKTRYQKDYAKSTKNLIESAYFSMKGDTLISSAKKSGETIAVDRLRNALKSNKVGGSKREINNGPSRPLWESISKQLKN